MHELTVLCTSLWVQAPGLPAGTHVPMQLVFCGSHSSMCALDLWHQLVQCFLVQGSLSEHGCVAPASLPQPNPCGCCASALSLMLILGLAANVMKLPSTDIECCRTVCPLATPQRDCSSSQLRPHLGPAKGCHTPMLQTPHVLVHCPYAASSCPLYPHAPDAACFGALPICPTAPLCWRPCWPGSLEQETLCKGVGCCWHTPAATSPPSWLLPPSR